jgi:hypothetical protein
MSSQEEEKKVQLDPCTKCQKPMKIINDFSLPVELTCGHEVCLKCILKELPEEETEIFCQVCDTSKKIKHELALIKFEKLEKKHLRKFLN